MPWAAIAKQQPLEMCSRWKNSANPVMITVIADGERVEPLSLILTHRAERVLARLNRRGEGIFHYARYLARLPENGVPRGNH
jgi:hypothetical protein